MRFSLRQSLLLIAAAAVLCLIARKLIKPTWQYQDPGVYHLVFSPNDERFALLANHPNDIRKRRLVVVDRASGRNLVVHDSEFISDPCFDNQGRLFSATIGFEVVVWDLKSGKRVCSVPRQAGGPGARGFSPDGLYLVLDPRFTPFGYDESVHAPVAFDLRSCNKHTDRFAMPSHWYGDSLANDASKYWGGGFHGPTPRVFASDNDFIGYCYRSPNISFASFTPDCRRLVTLHTDGALFSWDLDDPKSQDLIPASIGFQSNLLNAQAITMMNTTDRLAYIDESGQLRTWAFHQ